eukprot:s1547_g11.t1
MKLAANGACAASVSMADHRAMDAWTAAGRRAGRTERLRALPEGVRTQLPRCPALVKGETMVVSIASCAPLYIGAVGRDGWWCPGLSSAGEGANLGFDHGSAGWVEGSKQLCSATAVDCCCRWVLPAAADQRFFQTVGDWDVCWFCEVCPARGLPSGLAQGLRCLRCCVEGWQWLVRKGGVQDHGCELWQLLVRHWESICPGGPVSGLCCDYGRCQTKTSLGKGKVRCG